MVRETLQFLLAAESYRILAVSDGNAALAMARQEQMQPDLVIADFNLPGGMNGLEVIWPSNCAPHTP